MHSETLRTRTHAPVVLTSALESTRAQPSRFSASLSIDTTASTVLPTLEFELANVADIEAITKIVSSYPDNHEHAQSRGFLRGRFDRDEYLQLIQDRCIRKITDGKRLVGFASVLPWAHKLISAERGITKFRIASIGCHWIEYNYSPVIKAGNISYIAEVAVDPKFPNAGARLIKLLPSLRAEYPQNYLVTTCSEVPVPNIHSATLVQRLGFERIGYVSLPFRLMNVGQYPGKIKLVVPFQSGIWSMKPLNLEMNRLAPGSEK